MQSPQTIAEMCFLGESVGAEEARAIGLCGRVVETEQLLAAAGQPGETVAAWSPSVVAIGKSAPRGCAGRSPDGMLGYLSEMTALTSLTEDSVEGMGAFLARRPPEWRGR